MAYDFESLSLPKTTQVSNQNYSNIPVLAAAALLIAVISSLITYTVTTQTQNKSIAPILKSDKSKEGEKKALALCLDSDGGQDHYVNGSIKYREYDSNGSVNATSDPSDDCVDTFIGGENKNALREYYCDANNKVQYDYFVCPNGCLKGVCNKQIEPIKGTSAKNLYYSLSTNWRTVQDTTNSFEIGYDPSVFKPIQNAKSITLAYMAHPGSNTIALVPYDGGSVHQAIYKQLGYDNQSVAIEKSKDYYENEYSYDGKRCLVLFGLNFSASGNIWGMCTVSPSSALFFSGLENPSMTEQFIQTFKLLKQ